MRRQTWPRFMVSRMKKKPNVLGRGLKLHTTVAVAFLEPFVCERRPFTRNPGPDQQLMLPAASNNVVVVVVNLDLQPPKQFLPFRHAAVS